MIGEKIDKPSFTWAEKRVALARQLRPYSAALLFLTITQLAASAINGVVPYLTGKFFDTLITPYLISGYPAWAVLLVVWMVVQFFAAILGVVIDRKERRTATELEAGIQARGFAHLLTLPIAFHKKHRTGEVVETISRSGWMLGSLFSNVLSIIPQFLTILIGIGISFTIYPKLAFILLGGIVLYLIVLVRTLPETAHYQEEGMRIWNRAFGDAQDAYTNVSTVKQAGAEAFETKKIFSAFYDRAVPLWYRMERIWSNLNFSQRIIVTATQSAVLFYSVFLVADGLISIGELIAFNAYVGMIIGPFVQLGRQWQYIQNGLTAVVRAEAIFRTEPEAYGPTEAVHLPDVRGNVTFEKVRFSYASDQPEVLKSVSFSAKAGESIALVGETGVGKSTIADLVSAYYFANEGRILIDGYDIKEVNLIDLRSRIAVVPQEVVLFNASIKDNIRYGRPGASDAEVRAVAAKAHADVFIEKFPEKYEQEVGERGIKLSVGQKQRVAIARAMLRDPSILILDEPTSALDAETERFITASFEALMRGRTTFIIAHRLSTVRKADRIIVLEDGVVAEEGSHSELMEKGGVYARLYNLHIGLHE